MSIPKLEELLADPAKVSLVPPEAIPALRGAVAELDTLLLGRLLSTGSGTRETGREGDRLLSAGEAARKLGVSKDAVYRNDYPFVVKIGKRRRFSERGIEKFIAARMGG